MSIKRQNRATQGERETIASGLRWLCVNHQARSSVMQKILSAFAIASVLGIATPALADVGSGGSIQRALMAAQSVGVVGFNEIQYYDGKWEIEGRDPDGKT